jgi:glutamate dehydrogenase
LSLAKAQQVKNTVIVPQGAKGGFVPKRLPAGGTREDIQAEAVACYKAFVSSLLALTDNIRDGKVYQPEATICRDTEDDAYLVVAADKGTATFSDIANGISESFGFWLGDAFASGGSAGYDHKKMAITARGAWEAVKRHFREIDIDIQSTPFSVAGVGDMSGDVFGNGMLLSKAIKLVAAFDHRDIIIDPDPDPALSFEERKRLFDLPRSSWQDYDKARLSAGSGIYSRSSKYIALSPQAQQLLGLKGQATPQEVMSAILRAPVDLLWFGGIGTFVRASSETDAQAGDRANDAIRITGGEIQAKVVGEGANLGLTQRARVEYCLQGGRLNTDAIDNSAGVNTSDVEVNIKIALGRAVSTGKLYVQRRNALLASMTDEVAGKVLQNNYLQTLAISLGVQRGLGDLGFQRQLMRKLEAEGQLDRALEFLPSDMVLSERSRAGQPLTRPELAVLLAYAKIDLYNDLINSSIPTDPYLGRALSEYFPPLMREDYADEIASHPLRREIISTMLTNEIINRGGSTFVVRLSEETGHGPADIATAFAAAEAVYGLEDIYAAIDRLDGKTRGQQQLDLYRRVQDLLRRQTAWFLRHGDFSHGLEPEISRYQNSIQALAADLKPALPPAMLEKLALEQAAIVSHGVPEDFAKKLAALPALSQALDIIMVANDTGAALPMAASLSYAVRDLFRLDRLAEASEALAAGDYFDRLAVNSTMAAVQSAQRAMVKTIIGNHDGDLEAWKSARAAAVDRVSRSLSDILDGGTLTLAKLTVAVAHLRELAGI